MSGTGESRIVAEFQALQEKAQLCFAGLSDVPAFGRKHWQPYFQRTFDVYNKLWKYQQEHRPSLENKDRYGMQRHEIGEIASKIGQLYYHYYLRTADTDYLVESMVFYRAIRNRDYFRNITSYQSPVLSLKQLRYYARFFVVLFLLNRFDIVGQLYAEFAHIVQQYLQLYQGSDAHEWETVLRELRSFLDQVLLAHTLSGVGVSHQLSYRMPASAIADAFGVEPMADDEQLIRMGTPIVMPTSFSSNTAHPLQLRECILVSNCARQLKFSEISVDFYRMIQTLEMEVKVPEAEGERVLFLQEDNTANPHKYILYRPILEQLLMCVATASKELGEAGALLLYLSADGTLPATAAATTQTSDVHPTHPALQQGGIALRASRHSVPESAALYPTDLQPFTRRPLFVIVESENSAAFQGLCSPYQQPLIVLLAPQTQLLDPRIGGELTLFLHSPLAALCAVCGVPLPPPVILQQAVQKMTEILQSIAAVMAGCSELDAAFAAFCADPFMAQLVVRFAFSVVLLSQHKKGGAKSSSFVPQSVPKLPTALITDSTVVSQISDLANLLGVREVLV
eukprot:TRINITY_DN4513_c0_g1_i1.p1 TRINITY_DN4513_c0_g1~~TRINITY_DN4513_c0_g1_i1.p1  ORF type:complete len:568 (+),score=115.97 TRINITY_DN4513_c0_g1_i1:85-1788(+)